MSLHMRICHVMIALPVFIEIYTNDPHFHHTVAYLSQQPVKPFERRIVETLIPQHIDSAGHSDIRRSAGQLPLCICNCKICTYVLDLRILYPRLQHHLDRRLSGRVEHQLTARKPLSHLLHERLHLIRQEIVEHTCRIEHRAVLRVVLIEPGGIVQIATDVFLALAGLQVIILFPMSFFNPYRQEERAEKKSGIFNDTTQFYYEIMLQFYM